MNLHIGKWHASGFAFKSICKGVNLSVQPFSSACLSYELSYYWPTTTYHTISSACLSYELSYYWPVTPLITCYHTWSHVTPRAALSWKIRSFIGQFDGWKKASTFPFPFFSVDADQRMFGIDSQWGRPKTLLHPPDLFCSYSFRNRNGKPFICNTALILTFKLKYLTSTRSMLIIR